MVKTKSGESIAGTKIPKKIKEQLEIGEERLSFLRAKHTGNSSLSEMLPYLATSGHNLYMKTIHLYLQSNLQAIYSYGS